MNILHYSLGFPPYRTGGLTKYSVDLMLEQVKNGDNVSCLWPGEIVPFIKKVSIKKRNDFERINSYEIINPKPVPLMNGINNIDIYISDVPQSYNVYVDFLKRVKPDIIHIHTLMGMHKEFLEVCRCMGIKTVFTSHDYFGLCPKVNLLYENMPCTCYEGCVECARCNNYAFSYKKIFLLQSPLYRFLKDNFFVKYLRNKAKNGNVKNDDKNYVKNLTTPAQYIKLRKYYCGILSDINKIHFNSTNTKKIYSNFIDTTNSEVISITHRHIANHKKKKTFGDKLRITYLAPALPYKGFNLLIDALDELNLTYKDKFELNIYVSPDIKREYLNVNEPYTYSQLEEIFDNTDILVSPSLWYETFGFTVLEAMSYGVPVLITENVGSRDIVENGKTGLIVKPDKNSLVGSIKNILEDRDILKKMNKHIVEVFDILTMDKHSEDIRIFYNK